LLLDDAGSEAVGPGLVGDLGVLFGTNGWKSRILLKFLWNGLFNRSFREKLK
jgi:hypothetical protein